MKRLPADRCACLALAGCTRPEPASVGREGVTTTVAAPVSTTLFPPTTTTAVPVSPQVAVDATLVRAEDGIPDPATPAADVAALGRAQQEAYRTLVPHPEWDGEVLAGGVPWPYLAAVHVVETGTGRIRGDSTAGAQGPMQFIPSTWAVYGRGGDITSTTDAV